MYFQKLPPACELKERFVYLKDEGKLIYKIGTGRHKAGARAGSATRKGYRQVGISGKVYSEHRVIWCMVTGEDPGELTIDHVNEIKDDNRLENLRLATHSEQSTYWLKNHGTKLDYNPACKYYYKNKRSGKWEVIIRINGKPKFCGVFKTEEEAQRQVQKEIKKNPRC
jgi:hypothetical protein